MRPLEGESWKVVAEDQDPAKMDLDKVFRELQ